MFSKISVKRPIINSHQSTFPNKKCTHENVTPLLICTKRGTDKGKVMSARSSESSLENKGNKQTYSPLSPHIFNKIYSNTSQHQNHDGNYGKHTWTNMLAYCNNK